MPIEKIDTARFLQLAKQHPVLDVRSPSEYAHAHIPGAHNLALFTDEERRAVGTAYKQISRETAIKAGLDYFGPKMRQIVEAVESLVGNAFPGGKTVMVHCWRGGMRSAGVAWLLDLYGFKVYTLNGGYKKFRRYVLDIFTEPRVFNIVGGYTGSGKTELLQQLAKTGQPVIDLEALACHKGSAFGNLGMPAQPTQEQFENNLGLALAGLPAAAPLWMEDESQRIGDINLPQPFWRQMRAGPLFFLDIPFEERLQHIIQWYGQQDREKMADAIIRIRKRLGGLEAKTALNFLIEDNITESFRVLLKYYDKWYSKSLHTREHLEAQLINLPADTVDATSNAALVVKKYAGKTITPTTP